MTKFFEKWATPYLAQKMVDEGYYMYSLCQLVRAKLNDGNIKELGATRVVSAPTLPPAEYGRVRLRSQTVAGCLACRKCGARCCVPWLRWRMSRQPR